MVARVVGSSPRSRGTLQLCSIGPAGGRVIPTPVGNSPSSSSRSKIWAVHPHARGELDNHDIVIDLIDGFYPL